MVETKNTGAKAPEPKSDPTVAATAPEGNEIPKLKFEPAGTQRKLKNLFTVKAFDPGGTMVQLPVADQINNNVAGSDQLIGLRHYVRKGFTVLWDFDKNEGAYCPMADCHAKWDETYRGYCTPEHLSTANTKENPGPFGKAATTSHNRWTKS